MTVFSFQQYETIDVSGKWYGTANSDLDRITSLEYQMRTVLVPKRQTTRKPCKATH